MNTPTKLPKMLEVHTRAYYDGLVVLGKPDPEMDDTLIVETRLTQLFQELDIPNTYYARIRTLLFGGSDPCVIMLRRGTSGMPSVVALRHPPSDEIFTDKGLTTRPHPGTVLLDALERVSKLEAWRESLSPVEESRLNVVEALRNHESRLAAIEASLTGETNAKNAQDRNNH